MSNKGKGVNELNNQVIPIEYLHVYLIKMT